MENKSGSNNNALKVILGIAVVLLIGTLFYTFNLKSEAEETEKKLTEEKALVLKDLIKLEIIIFKKEDQYTRKKHVFLNEKGKKIFNEIFDLQKKRIYNALLNSSSEEVINFDNVLSKIING